MTEEFRKYDDRIEGSNLGRIKKDGELIEPCQGKVYDYVVVDGIPLRVHNIIGELFPEICGEHNNLHLHHINHNQRDNRAENLVYLTNSEHHRLHQQEDGVSVPVKAYDEFGNYVGRWDSKCQAAEATGVDYRHISEMVNKEKGRLTAGGYVWFKEDAAEDEVASRLEPVIARSMKRKEKTERAKQRDIIRRQNIERRKELIRAKKKKKKVLEFDDKGNLVKEWNNTQEIADYYGVSYVTIYNNIAGKTEFFKKGGSKRYFIMKKYMPS